MNGLRYTFLVLVGIVFPSGIQTANAQFYGGGFYGGSNMAVVSPYSMGYAPIPYGMMPPGYVGGYGYNPGFSGFGSPGFGMYGGGMGYGMNGMAYGGMAYGYPGFGWWPMSATDVRVSVVKASDTQQRSLSMFGNGYSGLVQQQQPTSDSLDRPTGQDIKLVCPMTAGGSLAYSLNGTAYTIQPGYVQSFRDDRRWKLEFQRGGDGTEFVGYTLKPGTYKFAVGTSGWELRQIVSDLPPAPQPTPMASPTPSPTPQP